MVALVSSDKVLIGVVVGIPLLVFALVLVATRPQLSRPVVAVATVAMAALVAVVVWSVFRPGPRTEAAGAQLAALPRSLATAPTPPPPPPPSAPPTSAAPACSPSGTTVNVSAQSIAFDTDCLAAPANTAFSLVFDNKDTGIPHNVEMFSDPSATKRLGGATDAGDFVTGPKTVTYKIPALPAGHYYFHCDLHPAQMHGDFVVA